VPLRDSHDWPLWGDEYGRMMVGNVLNLNGVIVSFTVLAF
jgi:hypothetical protein